MPTIEEGKRLSKRILLTNLLINNNNLALTPLLSGKHGIGKSQVGKNIAKELGGICLTIEGGTLKEGEITGIPYQDKNEDGQVEFRFLPYYIVKRIQEAEKHLNFKENKTKDIETILEGNENIYSNNELSFEEKKNLIKEGKIKPVILFFDEINRTDSLVFRELMNVILTKTINGYKLPWWVFIIAAMNPSTENSIYNTNEMDPAQTDRFIKIKVEEDQQSWINYALENEFDESLVNFIANNDKCLSNKNIKLEDEDSPTPSPRGWEMVNLILKSKDILDDFFTKKELNNKEKDIYKIISSKVGGEATAMLYASIKDKKRVILAKDIFDQEEFEDEIKEILKEQSTARNSITSKNIIDYLKNNLDDNLNEKNKIETINNKLKIYIDLIDNSSKLLFSQWLVNSKTKNNVDIFDMFYDVFDEKLIRLLEVSNKNNLKIKEGI